MRKVSLQDRWKLFKKKYLIRDKKNFHEDESADQNDNDVGNHDEWLQRILGIFLDRYNVLTKVPVTRETLPVKKIQRKVKSILKQCQMRIKV